MWKISVMLLVMTCCINAQEIIPDTLEDNYSTAFSEYAYFHNNSTSIHQIGMTSGYIYPSSSLEYKGMSMKVSFVRRKSQTYRYSFQFPVEMLLVYLGQGIDKLLDPNRIKDYDTKPSLIQYILLSPNSSIQYKFGKNTAVGISTTTNYLFIKYNGLDRGILFSPAIGMTLLKDSKRNRGGLTFSLSYSHFINFDGANEYDGFGFKINLYWITTS